MSTEIIQLFPKRVFDVSSLGASDAIEFVIVKTLDVAKYRRAALGVRVHDKTIEGRGAIQVRLKTTWPSSDDPEKDFVADDNLVIAVIDAEGPGGGLSVQSFEFFGPFLRVTVRGMQDGTQRNIRATLSADLALIE